jgi:RNA polymerase sigma-70 factor (ECF subfamily)
MSFSRSGKPDPRTDEELLHAYREKQELNAYEIVLSRHLHIIYLETLSYLKDQEEAKEATMLLCETLQDKVRKYAIQKFLPWLKTVTRNHCIQLLKEKQRLRTEELDEKSASIFVDFPDFSHLDKEDDIYERLSDAIDELKQEQRICVILFYLQEKSYKDIASITGYTNKEVKTHLQNGRLNLKKKLTSGK